MFAIPEGLVWLVGIGVSTFLVILLVLYAIMAMGLHYDDVINLIKNKINVNRYLWRYPDSVIHYTNTDNLPLTPTTPPVELAVLLSRVFGVTLTPGDFAYMQLVTKDNVTVLQFKCAKQCRLFYGTASIPVVQHIKIRTDSIIVNPDLPGLSVPLSVSPLS